MIEIAYIYIYIYILCLIIIIKSEVWFITLCLGLGHETMVSAVWLSIFLSFITIDTPNVFNNRIQHFRDVYFIRHCNFTIMMFSIIGYDWVSCSHRGSLSRFCILITFILISDYLGTNGHESSIYTNQYNCLILLAKCIPPVLHGYHPWLIITLYRAMTTRFDPH